MDAGKDLEWKRKGFKAEKVRSLMSLGGMCEAVSVP